MRVEYSKSRNVVYTIDEANGTVMAKLLCHAEDPQLLFDNQLFKHILGNDMGPVQESDIFPIKFQIKNEYIGKAKCHPDDKFDIEFGKRLALLRAKSKYLRAIEHKMFLINDWIYDLSERTNELYLKQYRYYIDNNSDLYILEQEHMEGNN